MLTGVFRNQEPGVIMPSGAIMFQGWLRVPASALTLAGFRRWAHSRHFPRRGKASFISGEVHLDMSPEEIRSHNSVKGDVFGAIGVMPEFTIWGWRSPTGPFW